MATLQLTHQKERVNRIARAMGIALALTVTLAARAERVADDPPQLDAEWAVSMDAQGHVLALKQHSTLKPALSLPLEQAIRSWTFEPGKLDGRPAPTETILTLSITLELTDDHYAIRIDQARTGGRFKKMVLAKLDRKLLHGNSTSYLYVMRIAYDANGKVVSIVPQDGSPSVDPLARKNMESAVREWLIEPERVDGHGIAASVEFPLCVTISSGPSGVRPLKSPCDWTQWKKSPTVGEGQFLALDPAAKLLTDVIGHTL
jgi:hypothetical protein